MGSLAKVNRTSTKEDDTELYRLSKRMKQLATEYQTHVDNKQAKDIANELAETTLEFLKVAGWSR